MACSIMPGAGFRPEIIVYVLIAEVQSGMVDHLALRTEAHDFSRSRAPRLVAVKEKVNVIIALQERNGLVEIGHRVKHNDIEGKCRMFLNGEIRKEIHKSLEYQHVLMAVVDGRYVFGGAASLETGGAELSSVAVVLETDSEIRIAVYPIVYLPAIMPGDVGIDAPLLDIANKGRMFDRPDLEDLNARFSRCALRRRRDSLNADKAGLFEVTYRLKKIDVVHMHDQVDNGTADTGSVVIPQIFRVVHMETRRVFLADRGEVHAPGRGFFDRSNTGLGEERPDVVLFYLFD